MLNEGPEIDLTHYPEDLPQMDDFKAIILNNTPLIDVRAPIEFEQGAFSMANNFPLMSNEEREQVGICYKNKGHEKAVILGHKLVNSQVREPRVDAWSTFITNNPTALLYCFRGGQRSKISQQWLADAGHDIVRLKGGYKAFRRYLIDSLDTLGATFQAQGINPIVVAGKTGAGKTLVLQRLKNSIDLEGLANHRGSAFGAHASPQPTQINFENNLAMDIIRFIESGQKNMVVEDEGRNIGSNNFSAHVFETLKSGERVVLDTTLDGRTQITYDEYVVASQAEYNNVGEWIVFMDGAFGRVQKRLGGEKHQRVMKMYQDANKEQARTGDSESHKNWINLMLSEYYDPMYEYQMSKNTFPVLFKGNMDEVVEFLQTK